MTVETILNLLWVLLGLLSWALCRRQVKSWRTEHRIAVVLLVLCLFPCVSATDDLANFGVLGRQLQQLGHAQVVMAFVFLLAWCVSAFVVFPQFHSSSEIQPAPAGRSPPLNAAF